MIFSAIERHNLVCQVIRTMGMIPDWEIDEEAYIDVGSHFFIYLPENDISTVVISFNKDIDPHYAADLAMRFCKVLDASGIRVEASSYFSECDSPVDSVEQLDNIDPSATIH